MRTLETLLILALGLALTRLYLTSLRRVLPSAWFEIGAIALLCVHLIVEHYRWQMLPTYLLLFVILAMGWLQPRQTQTLSKSRWFAISLTGILAILYLVSAVLPMLLPIPQLTSPSGPYAVGTRSWHWIDTSRLDPYAPTTNAPREIMVQAWYPIEQNAEGERSPWMPAAKTVAPAVAGWLELPSFFLDHLVLVSSRSLLDADIASSSEGFPVLLFSHGFGGFRAQNTNQMQHLASYGYVVAAVEHTYAAVVSVFPDGRVATHNPDTLPDGLPAAADLQAARDLGTQWAGDISFVLDQLSAIQNGSKMDSWQGQLDLTRVGAFGHSTGGGAAIEFCFRDPRCKATLTLDPFMKPISDEALKEGLQNPTLHIFSEVWTSDENLNRFTPFAQNSYPSPLVISILGSAHYDFSDLPLLSPLAYRIGLKGPINGERMVSIVNDYLLAYFNQSLRGELSYLLTGPSADYPEAIFQYPGDES